MILCILLEVIDILVERVYTNKYKGIPLQPLALTFPDEDLAVRAVVQNEAVSGVQRTLSERVLCCHQGDGHPSAGIGHLQEEGLNKRGGYRCWLLISH